MILPFHPGFQLVMIPVTAEMPGLPRSDDVIAHFRISHIDNKAPGGSVVDEAVFLKPGRSDGYPASTDRTGSPGFRNRSKKPMLDNGWVNSTA